MFLCCYFFLSSFCLCFSDLQPHLDSNRYRKIEMRMGIKRDGITTPPINIYSISFEKGKENKIQLNPISRQLSKMHHHYPMLYRFYIFVQQVVQNLLIVLIKIMFILTLFIISVRVGRCGYVCVCLLFFFLREWCTT